MEELQCAFKSRTEQLHHQSVSLAACDVIAASEGNSLSLLLRHIRETDSMAGCCLGWLREEGTEDGCQGNTNEEADQSFPRQTNKQNCITSYYGYTTGTRYTMASLSTKKYDLSVIQTFPILLEKVS